MDSIELVSEIISKALHLSGLGCSSKFSKINRNRVNSKDTMYFALTEIFRQYHGGSSAEGTSTIESDVDRMMVVPGTIVCSDDKRNIKKAGHIFQMDFTKCRPGFTKLSPLQIEASDYDLFRIYGKDIKEMMDKDEYGTIVFSSEKFSKFILSIPATPPPAGKQSLPAHYRHGPASTCFQHDYHGYVSGKCGIKIEFDLSHGLLLDEWPAETEEWVTRHREYSWPGKDLVKKVRNLDCHVVPVGDKLSGNEHLEWRMSFLLGERELVWNFSDVQIQLYFLLKKIVKYELDPIYPDQLSSYHAKMTVFWYSESHDTSRWNCYDLLRLLKECLFFILSCVEKGELQHYFHRKRNLLYSKFQDAEGKKKIVDKIQELAHNIVSPVVAVLNQQYLIDTWRESSRNPTIFIKKCEHFNFLQTSFPAYRYQNEQFFFFKCIFNIYISEVETEIESLCRIWKYFEANEVNDIDQNFFSFVIKFLALRLGISFRCESLKDKNAEHFEILLRDAEMFIIKGKDIDVMSGYLYLSSFYLSICKFDMAITILTSMMKRNYDTGLIYPGLCSKKQGIVLTPDKMFCQIEYPFPRQGTALNATVGFDVAFSADDVLFVPYPVKFECVLVQEEYDGFIVIHPVIYTYFLMTFTLCQCGRFQEALEFLQKLEISVDEAENGMQHFRALNLLGYCNFLFGRLDVAYEYFEASVEETYIFGHYLNAAFYHIIILIFHLKKMGKLTFEISK